MSYALNNTATADGYTTANTLVAPGSRRVNIDVANAAVFMQLGRGVGGIVWEPEVFYPASFKSLERVCDAVRVRSAAAGKPAQVTVNALTAEDLGG